jgi:hypothetical protein
VLNTAPEIYEELIEQRVMQALCQSDVLPYQVLKTRAAAGADDRALRRVLQGLIASGLVTRKADRRCVWYLGYAQAQPANDQSALDDLPAPFAQLLRELAGSV